MAVKLSRWAFIVAIRELQPVALQSPSGQPPRSQIMTLGLLGRGFIGGSGGGRGGGGGGGGGGGPVEQEKLYASSRPVPPHFSAGAAWQGADWHSAWGRLWLRAAAAARSAVVPQKQWLPPSMPATARRRLLQAAAHAPRVTLSCSCAWYRGSSGVAQPVWQPVSSKQPSRAATLHVPAAAAAAAGGARPKAAAGSRPWWSTINARSRERAAAYDFERASVKCPYFGFRRRESYLLRSAPGATHSPTHSAERALSTACSSSRRSAALDTAGRYPLLHTD